MLALANASPELKFMPIEVEKSLKLGFGIQ